MKFGWMTRVPALNIDIYPGQYLQYDEDYTSFGTTVHNYSRIHTENKELNVNELH